MGNSLGLVELFEDWGGVWVGGMGWDGYDGGGLLMMMIVMIVVVRAVVVAVVQIQFPIPDLMPQHVQFQSHLLRRLHYDAK